jgi:glycosyltransferase involved in cell wall biosynthesis
MLTVWHGGSQASPNSVANAMLQAHNEVAANQSQASESLAWTQTSRAQQVAAAHSALNATFQVPARNPCGTIVSLDPSLGPNVAPANALLSLVVPVYNEQAALQPFVERVIAVMAELPDCRFELVFVDDGSVDATREQLRELVQRDRRVRALLLSRNFGKEAALSAGLDAARGDAVIPLDVDLQDPPELIVAMVARWREGFPVVLARRTDRRSDALMKRTSANWFYRVHNRLADVQLPDNVGDFRLLDRRVVEVLRTLPESRRFMKGIFAWVGFKTATVDYTRPQRESGASRFTPWRLWNLALEGITSFSTAPLRIWTYVGGAIAALALLYAGFIVAQVLWRGVDAPGYASLITVVLFLGGLQLVGLGVLGEYIGRTYLEAKRRPVYVVETQYEQRDDA